MERAWKAYGQQPEASLHLALDLTFWVESHGGFSGGEQLSLESSLKASSTHYHTPRRIIGFQLLLHTLCSYLTEQDSCLCDS